MPKISSPLRYPGGKSQFTSKLRKVLSDNNLEHFTYAEVYAGGFGIGCNLLLEGLVDKVIINDIDYGIFSFWNSIIFDTENFIDKLRNTPITVDEWKKQKIIYSKKESYSQLEAGFATFFLNRTNRSGIIKANPIGGINQNGDYKIDCRFNKITIIEKINKLAANREKIVVENLDAIDFIKKYSEFDNILWFIDPPYFNKGNKLYTNFYKTEDHEKLSTAIKKELTEKKWILTYDSCEEIGVIYSWAKEKDISMSYTASTKRKEKEKCFFNNIIF